LASQKRLENKYKAAEQASADWYGYGLRHRTELRHMFALQ